MAAVRPSTGGPDGSTGAGGTTTATGLVAESGGIIVTTWRRLAGATPSQPIESDGTREPAAMVGIDPTSGMAVLRIDDDLPVADLRR